MVALPLLDIVIASPGASDRPPKIASQMVRSALGDLEQIERLDDSLATDSPESFDRQAAALLRGMYERWVQDAELLLDRIAHIERRSGTIIDSDSLRHALGRTRARLSVSLEDMEEGLRDALEGRTVPMEEVRRELRLRMEQTGAAAVPGTGSMAGGGGAG